MLKSGLNQRRKIKVSSDTFVPGLWCDFDDHHGYIRFVCESYVTLCISSKPSEDKNARRNLNECCIVVYKEDWDRIIPCITSGSHWMWRLWAKALGQKEGKDKKDADKVALIRTLIMLQLVTTNGFIIANAVRHWNNVPDQRVSQCPWQGTFFVQ